MFLSRITLLITLLGALYSLPSSAQSTKTKGASPKAVTKQTRRPISPNPAVAYGETITHEQFALNKLAVVYSSIQAHSHDNLAIDSIRRGIVSRCQEAIATVSALPPLKGSTAFRDEAVAYFKQFEQQYSTDTQTLDFERDTNTETVEAIEAYFKKVEAQDEKMTAAQKRVRLAFGQFVTLHDLRIITPNDKVEEYTKRINAVNSYQDRIFFARFRLRKPIAQMEDAIAAKDVTALEAARSSLIHACQLSGAYLQTIKPFREKDSGYRDATIRYVDFYASLANTQLASIVSFYSKQESELTNEDIDTFNACVKYYNTSRDEQSRAYTTAREAFEARNIPYIKSGQD